MIAEVAVDIRPNLRLIEDVSKANLPEDNEIPLQQAVLWPNHPKWGKFSNLIEAQSTDPKDQQTRGFDRFSGDMRGVLRISRMQTEPETEYCQHCINHQKGQQFLPILDQIYMEGLVYINKCDDAASPTAEHSASPRHGLKRIILGWNHLHGSLNRFWRGRDFLRFDDSQKGSFA